VVSSTLTTADQSALAEQARVAQDEYLRHERQLAQARAIRDQAIRDALQAGVTQRQLAAATGLTHGRIAQIALHRR